MPSLVIKRSCGALRAADVDATVELNGWVNKRRDHGGLIFVDLRDRDGITQVVFDPQHPCFKDAEHLRHEDVISVRGTVRNRPAGTENAKLPTGEIEVGADDLEVLNRSLVPPFPVNSDEDVDENLRLQYRYLDLRRPRLQRNIAVRHKIVKAMRDFFDDRGFLEIETPMLIKSTPEGARDYLVPSRLSHGSFYALPQSPQILKQILMVSGFGRYMQIARCMRDEDLRADRQPEFTQIDVEMSFATQEDVLELMESAMRFVWKRVLDVDLPAFPRFKHAEVMSRYGSDKPDLRFGLELLDVSSIFAESEFKVYRDIVSSGGVVIAVPMTGAAKSGRRYFDELEEFAKLLGSSGMGWLAISQLPQGSAGADYEVILPKGGSMLVEVKSSIKRFLNNKMLSDLHGIAGEANKYDAYTFIAGKDRAQVLQIAGKLRVEIARRSGLLDPNKFAFAWVTDFPLFEVDEETGQPAPAHHPFTAPGEGQWDLIDSEPLKMRAQHYDMVLNGYELGSGSIRIHKPEFQRRIFEMLGMSEEQIEDRFGFFIRALDYGAPPHGGMALGIDRIVMLAVGETNIRDVIAFPKNQLARDVMMDAPSEVPSRLLRDLGLAVQNPAPTGR